MSTTGPVTRAMRPTPASFLPGAVAMAVSVMIAFRWRVAYLAEERASAPPTISEICWVISDWRALLASLV